MKKVALGIAALAMTASAALGMGQAHADPVQCHLSSGGALWRQEMGTGQSWRASTYGSYPFQPYCPPYVTSVQCSD